MKTTLNKIRENHPCTSGWRKLLHSLDKTAPDDEPLPLLHILESNGLEDTVWCFRAVDGYDKEKRLFAVWCARQVEHLLTDERSKKALQVAEDFANGKATKAKLGAAYSAAVAANTAAGAARAANTATNTAAVEAAYAADYAAHAAANTAAYAAAVAAAAAAANATNAAAYAAYDPAAQATHLKTILESLHA